MNFLSISPRSETLSKFSSALAIVCGVSAIALSGCHVRSSHSNNPPLLLESEPNDGAAFAEGVGAIRPGTRLSIRGSVVQNQVADNYETDWDADFFDGFAFVVDEPCELYLTLYADRPFADLDIWVYDPFDQSFIAQFEDIFDPELGAVVFPWVGEEFHVVVSSYNLDSFYTLELEAFPLAHNLATTIAALPEEVSDPKFEGRARPRVVVGRELPTTSGSALEAVGEAPAKDPSRYEHYREGQLEKAPNPIRIEAIPIDLPTALTEEIQVTKN